MKVEKKFIPVIITLETQEEFDYLYGLTKADYVAQKEDCDGFSEYIDDELSTALTSLK